MLDAILCAAIANRRKIATPLLRSDQVPEYIRNPIYMKKIGDWLVPCCSNPITAANTNQSEFITKRLALEHSSALSVDSRNIVSTSSHTYKGYRVPLRINTCDRVVWFVLANKRSMSGTLRGINSTGVKRSIGYGRVAEWEVEDCADDYSLVANVSGIGNVLMRQVPIENDFGPVIGWKRGFKAVRWPYFHPGNFIDVMEPC